MENQLHIQSNGVTPVNAFDNYLIGQIIAYTDFIRFDKSKVRPYIPERGNTKSFTCFKVLLLIARHPKSCEFDLIKSTGNKSVNRCIHRLIELDLIKRSGRPRLIIPFKKFKVDNSYVITTKGKNVVEKVLEKDV